MEPCDILENRQKKLFGPLSYLEKETKIDDEGQEEGEKEVTRSNLLAAQLKCIQRWQSQGQLQTKA